MRIWLHISFEEWISHDKHGSYVPVLVHRCESIRVLWIGPRIVGIVIFGIICSDAHMAANDPSTQRIVNIHKIFPRMWCGTPATVVASATTASASISGAMGCVATAWLPPPFTLCLPRALSLRAFCRPC